MNAYNSHLEPGDLVRLPAHSEFGIGQIQSIAGNLVTVNFEHAGKLSLNGDHVILDFVDRDDPSG